MENLTPSEIWAVVAWVAAAIVLLGNASDRIAKAWKAAKAPNDEQNDRLDQLEEDVKEMRKYLEEDKKRLDSQDESGRITQRALLALLAHGIDGNHVEQMEAAKEELQNHLINR